MLEPPECIGPCRWFRFSQWQPDFLQETATNWKNKKTQIPLQFFHILLFCHKGNKREQIKLKTSLLLTWICQLALLLCIEGNRIEALLNVARIPNWTKIIVNLGGWNDLHGFKTHPALWFDHEQTCTRHTMMQNIDPALANMDLIYSIDPNRGRTKCCPEIQSKCRC